MTKQPQGRASGQSSDRGLRSPTPLLARCSGQQHLADPLMRQPVTKQHCLTRPILAWPRPGEAQILPGLPCHQSKSQVIRICCQKLRARQQRGAALGGLVGSLFGLFGGNWLINFLAGLGASLWQVTKKLAKAPVKAVKYAAAATGSMVRKHGKWLAIVGGLALVAFTGVVFFDAQWKAGLVIGAGLAGASFYGLKRGRKFGAGLMAKVSPKKTANAAA